MKGRRDPGAAPRLVAAGSVALGVVMVSRPRRVSRTVSGRRTVGDLWVRVLGARYLAQGVAQIAWPRPAVLAGSAAVDAIHAVSMVALATVRPEYRRPALISALTATTGGLANALAAGRATRTRA